MRLLVLLSIFIAFPAFAKDAKSAAGDGKEGCKQSKECLLLSTAIFPPRGYFQIYEVVTREAGTIPQYYGAHPGLGSPLDFYKRMENKGEHCMLVSRAPFSDGPLSFRLEAILHTGTCRQTDSAELNAAIYVWNEPEVRRQECVSFLLYRRGGPAGRVAHAATLSEAAIESSPLGRVLEDDRRVLKILENINENTSLTDCRRVRNTLYAVESQSASIAKDHPGGVVKPPAYWQQKLELKAPAAPQQRGQ